jgi:hypothetical protein
MVNLVAARFIAFALLAAGAATAALPEPPKQHEPWQPPSSTSLPDFIVKVAGVLFDAGLADPRGGVYRQVEILDRVNGKTTVQTHAWLFPGDFAVCWNGLVYRVRSAGAGADLDRDVQTILSARPWSGRMPFIFEVRGESDRADAAFWSEMQTKQTIVPASIALLLRLGRLDLAEKFWEAPETPAISGQPAGTHENEQGLWLATAATAWFATAYGRLVEAFGVGQDQEAADVAGSILEWRSRVPDSWRVENNRSPKRVPDISFLDPVPQLAADINRRLREPAGRALDLQAISEDKDRRAEFWRMPQAARIRELIDRLDGAYCEKLMFPGPLFCSFDPDYVLLKQEGDAAVEALIEVYGNDQRLTRSFDYGRPWSIVFTPVSVHHFVELLLGDMLGNATVAGKSAPELLSWWRQHQAGDRAERSLEILASDQATPEQWLEATDFLTTRSDVQWSDTGKMRPPGACDPGKPAPVVNGEQLRSRRNPSVSELLAKRVVALMAQGSDIACSIAVKAALWDRNGALPVLKQAANLRSCRANHLVAVARLSLGDGNAAADWTAELPNHPKFPPLLRQELAPLWMFPEDPVLEQLAESLFGHDDSPWWPAKKYADINSPLLAIPAYRRAVLSALEDSTVVGRAGRTSEGYLSFQVANGGGGSPAPSTDPRQAARGEQRPIRAKDLVAWELSSLEGAPEFGLDWTTADKDAAIPALTNFLSTNGADLKAFPSRLQEIDCPGDHVFWDRPHAQAGH